MPKMFTILVKRVDNLGDVIFILPVLRELRKIYPLAHIILMVKKEHRGVLFSYADSFLPPRKDTWLLRNASRFDKIINIAYEIPRQYTEKRLHSKKYIHLGIKSFRGPQPVFYKLLKHLREHVTNVSFKPPEIYLNPLLVNRVSRWHSRMKIPNRLLQLKITLDPGSSFAKKCWPLSYYAQLCKWLINHFNAHIFILGAENDKRIKTLKLQLPDSNSTTVAGKPIEFISALINQCHLHIGNDSGLGHVAAALKIPTVTVFGPTAPHLWRPAGTKAITVYDPMVACEGGYDHAATCKLQKCLYSIKPASVADAVLASINLFLRSDNALLFDTIQLSFQLHIKKTGEGVVLKNRQTGHSCLVLRGWDAIKPVFKVIDGTNSYQKTLYAFPKEKQLLDMLLVHRIIVPGSSGHEGPFI